MQTDLWSLIQITKTHKLIRNYIKNIEHSGNLEGWGGGVIV